MQASSARTGEQQGPSGMPVHGVQMHRIMRSLRMHQIRMSTKLILCPDNNSAALLKQTRKPLKWCSAPHQKLSPSGMSQRLVYAGWHDRAALARLCQSQGGLSWGAWSCIVHRKSPALACNEQCCMPCGVSSSHLQENTEASVPHWEHSCRQLTCSKMQCTMRKYDNTWSRA